MFVVWYIRAVQNISKYTTYDDVNHRDGWWLNHKFLNLRKGASTELPKGSRVAHYLMAVVTNASPRCSEGNLQQSDPADKTVSHRHWRRGSDELLHIENNSLIQRETLNSHLSSMLDTGTAGALSAGSPVAV